MLSLQDQDLEHGDGIERLTTAFAAIAMAQSLDKPRLETLKVHGAFQNLQWIAMAAQHLKVIVQAEKRLGIHDTAHPMATRSMKHEWPISAIVLAGVQLTRRRPGICATPPAT